MADVPAVEQEDNRGIVHVQVAGIGAADRHNAGFVIHLFEKIIVPGQIFVVFPVDFEFQIAAGEVQRGSVTGSLFFSCCGLKSQRRCRLPAFSSQSRDGMVWKRRCIRHRCFRSGFSSGRTLLPGGQNAFLQRQRAGKMRPSA